MSFGSLLELARYAFLIGRPQIAVLYCWKTNTAGENNTLFWIPPSLGPFRTEGHSGSGATSCLIATQRDERPAARTPIPTDNLHLPVGLMCISLDSGRMDDNDVLFGPETK